MDSPSRPRAVAAAIEHMTEWQVRVCGCVCCVFCVRLQVRVCKVWVAAAIEHMTEWQVGGCLIASCCLGCLWATTNQPARKSSVLVGHLRAFTDTPPLTTHSLHRSASSGSTPATRSCAMSSGCSTCHQCLGAHTPTNTHNTRTQTTHRSASSASTSATRSCAASSGCSTSIQARPKTRPPATGAAACWRSARGGARRATRRSRRRCSWKCGRRSCCTRRAW